MKRLFSILAAVLVSSIALANPTGRTVENFNFGWKFNAGDVQGAE